MSWSDRPRYRAKTANSHGSAATNTADEQRDGWLISEDRAWRIFRDKGLVKQIAYRHRVSCGAVIAIKRGKRVPQVYQQYHAAQQINAALVAAAFGGV
jgi:hypothetical protein